MSTNLIENNTWTQTLNLGKIFLSSNHSTNVYRWGAQHWAVCWDEAEGAEVDSDPGPPVVMAGAGQATNDCGNKPQGWMWGSDKVSRRAEPSPYWVARGHLLEGWPCMEIWDGKIGEGEELRCWARHARISEEEMKWPVWAREDRYARGRGRSGSRWRVWEKLTAEAGGSAKDLRPQSASWSPWNVGSREMMSVGFH